MSETQLREAYTLMKQGDKRASARLIQEVLRADRNNHQAWWLFSHLLEDEEKIVKSLEKVLALNPEHAGARKRLAQMRPEYAHLVPLAETATLGKTKAGIAKPNPKQSNKTGLMGGLIGLVIFAITCVATMSFPVISNMIDANTLANVEGPAPDEVALRQFTAALTADYETMRQYTCDSLEDEWEANMDEWYADFSETGVSIKDLNFDFSGIRFEETNAVGLQKTFSLTGELSVSFQGQEVSLDIEEMTGFELRMILVVNDNRWVVCST